MYVPLLVSGPLLLVLRVDRKLIPPVRPREGMEKEGKRREGELEHVNAPQFSRKGGDGRVLYCTSSLDRCFPWRTHISSRRWHRAHVEAVVGLRGEEKGEG
jgi:hypothetical protein